MIACELGSEGEPVLLGDDDPDKKRLVEAARHPVQQKEGTLRGNLFLFLLATQLTLRLSVGLIVPATHSRCVLMP